MFKVYGKIGIMGIEFTRLFLEEDGFLEYLAIALKSDIITITRIENKG